MGELENFVKILKWGGYNKRELAEKNGRKIKGAPPVIRVRRVYWLEIFFLKENKNGRLKSIFGQFWLDFLYQNRQ